MGSAPGVPFEKGKSGNPGGRPKGLERYSRELVGDDGKKLADFWLEVMQDGDAKLGDRMKASELLASRAFGRPPQTLEIAGEGGGPVEHKHTGRLTFADVASLANSLAANGSS